ncbi:MAG: hypothetical protein PUB72_05680, partial [Ruminococcus sp.]|nr:hypothetical protein [Ruminococcus sp.]
MGADKNSKFADFLFSAYSNSTIDKKREIMYNNSQKELKNMIPVEIRKLIIKNREEGVKVSEI